MSVKRKLRSRFINALLSPAVRRLSRMQQEVRRRLLHRPHVVSAFLQLDDPYSYLLAHYLPSLRDHYDIELRLYLSEARGDAFQPAPDMLAEYAVRDCERLAHELGIPFLDKGTSPPVEHRRSMLDTIASCQDDATFDEELLQALSVFWRGDAEAASRRSAAAEIRGQSDSVIQGSQKLQRKLGHYNSATLHYGGEWYWGVDRLHYLLQRLDDLALAENEAQHPLLSSLGQATTGHAANSAADCRKEPAAPRVVSFGAQSVFLPCVASRSRNRGCLRANAQDSAGAANGDARHAGAESKTALYHQGRGA